MGCLYVAYWPDQFFRDCVEEACALIEGEFDEGSNLRLIRFPLTPEQGSFNPLSAYSRIAGDLGPVLFVGRLRQSAIATVQTKIARRVVTHQCDRIADSTDVYEAILELIRRHEAGEPLWPRRHVVAIRLIAKLVDHGYWGGGALNKAFLIGDDLAKGRGLDERYKDIALEVAEFLSSDQRQLRLMKKKKSKKGLKYACNSDEAPAIYAFLRERTVPDEFIMRWLSKDDVQVPNSELADIRPEIFVDPRSSEASE